MMGTIEESSTLFKKVKVNITTFHLASSLFLSLSVCLYIILFSLPTNNLTLFSFLLSTARSSYQQIPFPPSFFFILFATELRVQDVNVLHLCSVIF
jgi:prepilin signal peptidase PulO-like enzyme (type II secretory pathway)